VPGPAPLTLVGLCGRSGAGKDTLADWVLAKHGFFKTPLAAAFKVAAVGEGRFTFDEVFRTKPEHVRTYLQYVGREGRAKDPDIWMRTLEAWLAFWANEWGLTRFVVTDVRFPNEVAWVKAHGGRCIAVHSDRGNTLTEAQKNDPTEAAVARAMSMCDGHVWNDTEMPWERVEAQLLERLREMSLL
jgi:hypothetical protein